VNRKKENLLSNLIPGHLVLERICDSFPHVIFKAQRKKDQAEVAIKTLAGQFPKRENIASIKREFSILKKVQGEDIIKANELIPFGNGNLAISMEMFGISISQFLESQPIGYLSVNVFFDLALKIVDALSLIHKSGVIHKDLTVRNILVDPLSLEIRIIDFSASSELAREHQDGNLSKTIAGSLPFMSPEQTGRMNRDIDYRTDYYALGMTFYQMLSGKYPFEANDALEWVHCHIGRKPIPLIQSNPKVPKSLSQLVAKLISKNAEERYQSSKGLKFDLQLIQTNVLTSEDDFEIELAKADISSQFHIPQKLYGRNEELEKLEYYFKNASNGKVEFILVSGYSGVGKSALVHELGRSIIKKQGYLIHGKFEQFRQNSSYSALSNAFRDLVRQLLGEPKNRLDHWDKAISSSLGSNAQVIIDLIPELVLIIGKQPEVQELSPAESQNRFLLLFLNLVKVFANELHPMVIFLDDLQWSDIPTLNLINKLVTSTELSNLLIICAYRDNAVDPTHPFSLSIDEIKTKRQVDELPLKPLSEHAVQQIVYETLLRKDSDAIRLAGILFQKTGGNPFFTIELLKNLHQQGFIYFEPNLGQWNWDQTMVQKVESSDNVIDFLIASQHRLKESTQQALQYASCIGAKFDLKTLALIQQSTREETASALYEALQANMIIPLSENYKLVGIGGLEEKSNGQGPEELDTDHLNPIYKFQHDRVQQAAYSIILPERRSELHLTIARLLYSHTSDTALEEVLMHIVGHFNAGLNLILDQEELITVARLNLKAGIKAKQSAAYDSALDYLKITLKILGDAPWDEHYALIRQLSEELQHCFYLTGDRTNADAWTEIMLSKAKTAIEKALVLSARTRQYATIGRMKESIVAAQAGLNLLGFNFNEAPSIADEEKEISQVELNLAGRSIEDILMMNDLTDPKAKIAGQLLMEIFPAAFLSGSGRMFSYLVLKSVNVALKYGNSPETAFAYGAYGMILCGYLDDPAKGFRYGKLSVELIDKFSDIALRSRIIYVYSMFVHHWSNHWSSMTPWFQRGIEAGYQSGDLLYLAYSAQDCIIWDPKLDLESASKEHRKLLKIVKECEYEDSYDSGRLFLQMQLNFQGFTEDLFSMSDDQFEEAVIVQGMLDRRFMTGIANYHIYKAEIHLLYNDFEGGFTHIQAQEKLMASVMSLPQLVRFHIVSFLTRSMKLIHQVGSERELVLEKMNASLSKMTQWANHCPENFKHLQLLMEAEMASHSGEMELALSNYEESIHLANQNTFIRDEAMANEMAGKYLSKIKLDKAAEGYFKAAHYLYYRWGAHRKVQEMEREFSLLIEVRQKNTLKNISLESTLDISVRSDSYDMDQLDMSSVFRASQMISGELVLDKLLGATLDILIENAGARRGILIEEKDGQLVILASAMEDEQESSESSLSDNFPITLVNTCIRTGEPIVITNASEPNAFSSDSYFMAFRPRSVMCVPMAVHKSQKLAIYLENNLTHSAFTDERIKIIKLLSAQAAISIENATIYKEQEKLLKAQERFVPIQFLKHLGHNDIAKVELGESVSMEMSVMFSDIRDFTPLVELLSPQAVIELLNQYYSKQGKRISEVGGFIDSYSGDEILALFAVPAQQAVSAGIKMGEGLWEFNKNSESIGRPLLKMGIGVNTGPLVLGTMGGQERMQCSVLGDTVNLASRIENLTKVYDSQFLISESTYNALENPAAFAIRLVDRVAVKGKEKAVRLYEVIDAEEDSRRKLKEATQPLLDCAFSAYFNRDFKTSISFLTEAIQIHPEDPVLTMLLNRSKKYELHAPPPNWQGFEVLTFK
jgi:predicted ATPase/class 3 adenylate cyclase